MQQVPLVTIFEDPRNRFPAPGLGWETALGKQILSRIPDHPIPSTSLNQERFTLLPLIARFVGAVLNWHLCAKRNEGYENNITMSSIAIDSIDSIAIDDRSNGGLS